MYTLTAGFNTIADGSNSVAMGSYNTRAVPSKKENRRFVIGNGTADTNRSDAFTVLSNGKVGIETDNFEDTSSDAALQVNGSIKLGDDYTYGSYNGDNPQALNMLCNANNVGTIRYNSNYTADTGRFEGCAKTSSSTYTWVGLH